MKKILRVVGLWAFVLLVPVMAGVSFGYENAIAEGYGVTMSPMNQNVIINPGGSRTVSLRLSNQYLATENVKYSLSVEPFFVDEDDAVYFNAEGDSSEITKWISFNVPTTGILEPNETKEILLTINVPENAPAGGQYASIIATLDYENETEGFNDNDGVVIKEVKRMAHLIYAEISGNTTKSGEITEANVPSFMFGGKITGSSIIKNTGNVHGTAKYTLQVFPLFSGEEVYTNEEEPETKTVMPNRTVYRETTWEETPGIGIFNVVYTVEFEGATAQVKKMVIICPIWLLFIIVFAILFAIFYVIAKLKKRSKN